MAGQPSIVIFRGRNRIVTRRSVSPKLLHASKSTSPDENVVESGGNYGRPVGWREKELLFHR